MIRKLQVGRWQNRYQARAKVKGGVMRYKRASLQLTRAVIQAHEQIPTKRNNKWMGKIFNIFNLYRCDIHSATEMVDLEGRVGSSSSKGFF